MVEVFEGEAISGGSGTHMGDGLIVTCKHVAGAVGRDARVSFPSGKRYEGKVVVVATVDLAAILCPGAQGEPAAELAPQLPVSGEVWQIGYPGYTMRSEQDSRHRHVNHGRLLGGGFAPWGATNRVSVHSASGDSGGGVFDPQGRLVGVLWGGDGQGGSCVTYRDTKAFLSEQCVRWWPGKAIGRPDPRKPAQPTAPAGPRIPTPADRQKLIDKLTEYERRLAVLEASRGTAGPPGPAGPPGLPGKDANGEASLIKLAGIEAAQTQILSKLDGFDKRISRLEQAPPAPAGPGSNRRTILQPVKP